MTITPSEKEYYPYFYGKRVSNYALYHGYVDYGTLASVGDAILCNKMAERDLELVNGSLINSSGDPVEIAQYYIVDDNLAKILIKRTNEIVFFDNELNVYVWGVTHWGTAWSMVLTEIPLTKE